MRHDIDPERVATPVMQPRGGVLEDRDRLFNRDLSSIRMPVEHAIGRMKWWRTMRYWRADPFRFGPTGPSPPSPPSPDTGRQPTAHKHQPATVNPRLFTLGSYESSVARSEQEHRTNVDDLPSRRWSDAGIASLIGALDAEARLTRPGRRAPSRPTDERIVLESRLQQAALNGTLAIADVRGNVPPGTGDR